MIAVPSLQRKCRCGGTPGPTGECDACRKKRLQRKIDNHGENASTVPPIVHEVLRSPGEPLDRDARAFFEPRLGHDFRNVRVHTDRRAAESARSVDALAYTVGRHIVFAEPRHGVARLGNQQLLAHELAHVIQQNDRDDVFPAEHIHLAPQASAAERQAEAVGRSIASDKTIPIAEAGFSGAVLQRGILDVLAAPFIALSRVFGAENYSDDELLDYYNDFVSHGKIENAYDSDNKARALVKRWKSNQLRLSPKSGKPQTINLSASDKVVLGKEMYQGHRSGDDIGCVLDLLRSSGDADVSMIISGMGEGLLNSEKETADFVAVRKRQKLPAVPSAAPERATAQTAAPPPQPRTAEGVAYEMGQSFSQQALSEENAKLAIGIFGKTDVANEVVEWLQKRSINITLRFVAQTSDIPGTEGVSAAGWFQKIGAKSYRVWVAAGERGRRQERTERGSIRFIDQVIDKKPEQIADTIFHELLHVWFTNRFPGSGTGHTAEVVPVKIGAQGGRYYDEEQYDQRFLQKLKEFDAQMRSP